MRRLNAGCNDYQTEFGALSKRLKAASHGLVLSPQGTLNFPVRAQHEYPQMGQGFACIRERKNDVNYIFSCIFYCCCISY